MSGKTYTEHIISKTTVFGLLVALAGVLYSHGYYSSFNVPFSELDSPLFIVVAQGVIKAFTIWGLLIPILVVIVIAIYLDTKDYINIIGYQIFSQFIMAFIFLGLAYWICEYALLIGREEAARDMRAETSRLPKITRLIIDKENKAVGGIDLRLVTAGANFVVYFSAIEEGETEVRIYSVRVNRERVSELETIIAHESE